MTLDNVQLWFARDKEDKIVTINEVNKEDKEKYYCPLCNSEVIPRQGEINSWCFAHIDKSKCSSESMYHFWVKNKLLQKGDKFKIQTDTEKEYICEEILVEKTYKVENKEYRPDLTIKTTSGDTIYFEMNYTNEKKLEDYLDTWIELGNIIVEVDVKTLINSKSGSLPIFKAKYYNGKCFNVKKGEDKIYYDTIGQHKERLIKNNEYDDEKKKEIEKLDWFWKDIQRYKMKEIDIEYISELIQNIESIDDRKIIVEILKRTKCQNIVQSYLQFNKNIIIKNINDIITLMDNKGYIKDIIYSFKTPRSIYDRLFYYKENFSITYKNEIIIIDINKLNKEYILNHVFKSIDSYENKIKCDLLDNNEELTQVFKYLKNKYKHYEVFKNAYSDEYFTRIPILEVGMTYEQTIKIDLSSDEILYSKDRKFLRNFIKTKIKTYEQEYMMIENLNEVEDTLKKITSRYKNICNRNEVNYRIKHKKIIQIKFTRNYRGLIYDDYTIYNNKLIWEKGKLQQEIFYLKHKENNCIDCNDLKEKLINKMADRLREVLYS